VVACLFYYYHGAKRLHRVRACVRAYVLVFAMGTTERVEPSPFLLPTNLLVPSIHARMYE
jgi:hypothetical protein